MATTDLSKLFLVNSADDGDEHPDPLLPLTSPTTHCGPAATVLNGVSGVSIGFDFSFDGVDYDECYITPCGFIRLAGTVTSANPAGLWASTTDVVIAPWWDDMITAHGGSLSGYVKSEVQGSAPFRRFVVEWHCFTVRTDTASDCNLITFQCVLYETRNAIEFRYGERVQYATYGGPSIASAAIGLKGDTSTDTNNYIEPFSAQIDPLTLPSDNWILRWEPNWPMCGLGILIDPEELTGFDPYSHVMWLIANFVNWLYCRHGPALVNVSPWQQVAAVEGTAATFVVPVEPSDDGRTYEVYLQVYASATADVTVDVDVDAEADPQWDDDLDWDQIGTSTQAVSAGWNELTAFEVTIPAVTTQLRFVASIAGTGSPSVIVGSILVRPKPLDEIDPGMTSLTGFIPMALSQTHQEGGAIHSEWFNRAYRNIAHVLRDLRQMVWSSVWPGGAALSLESETERDVRTIGVSKSWLGTWRKQACKARIVARDTSDGAPLMLAEQGHALLAEFTVNANGGEFRAQTEDVELLSNAPLITATCDPVTELWPMAVVIDWAPELSTENLLPGVTPAPKLAYLDALAARMELALRCYAHCGQATMLARGKTTSNPWRVQTIVGPAVKALRPIVCRDNTDQTVASGDTEIEATSSGSGANDQILIPPPHTRGRDDYPPEGLVAVAASAESFEAAPAAPMNRLMESPTSDSVEGSVRERVEVLRGVGITFASIPGDALEIAEPGYKGTP